MLDQCVFHIPDLLAEPDVEFGAAKDIARRLGYRACLAVPMLREGKVVGSFSMRRTEALPFSDKQIDLLKTFADQAVIAIENTRSFTELQERLEQQTATSEILRVISQSQRDVQPVFETIATSARELCSAKGAAVFTFDGELLHRAASCDATAQMLPEPSRDVFPRPASRDNSAGRAIL